MHTFAKNPGILTRDWQLTKTHIRKPTLYTSNKDFCAGKHCRYSYDLWILPSISKVYISLLSIVIEEKLARTTVV